MAFRAPWTPLEGVNLIGYFRSDSGVGQAARNVHRALKHTSTACRLINCTSLETDTSEYLQGIHSKKNLFPVSLFNCNADMTPSLFLDENYASFLYHYNIGYWNWELENFPGCWLESFAFYDEIWAPSTFTQKSIQAKSPIPVYYIPYSINIPQFPEHLNRQYFGLREDRFIFLFVFSGYSFFARKNPEAAIKAFKQAFGHQQDVQLVIKMIYGKGAKESTRALQKLEKLRQGLSNIIFIDQVYSRDESYALMSACDSFISLHRSEGYGLNMCEAMAMGKPVIATNYSANTDYLNDANGYLVDCQIIKLNKNHGPYKKGEIWAEPNISHAASLMRRVYENRSEAAQKGDQAKKTIESHYTDSAVGQKIQERLNAIYHHLEKSNTSIKNLRCFEAFTNIATYPIDSHRPVIGLIIVWLKKIARWLIFPALENQSTTNHLFVKSTRNAFKQVDYLKQKIDNLRKIKKP